MLPRIVRDHFLCDEASTARSRREPELDSTGFTSKVLCIYPLPQLHARCVCKGHRNWLLQLDPQIPAPSKITLAWMISFPTFFCETELQLANYRLRQSLQRLE